MPRKGAAFELPPMALPVLWVLIVLGTAYYGYSWRNDLNTQSAALSGDIANAEAQLAELQSVIAENEAFEARREMLEDRITTIASLQREQVSPLVLLDQLSRAMTPINYVWLSQLQQNDTVVTMAGTGTSLNAIADFISSLEATGYFTNINFVQAQETEDTFSFQMNCDFVPPVLPQTDSSVENSEGGEETESEAP